MATTSRGEAEWVEGLEGARGGEEERGLHWTRRLGAGGGDGEDEGGRPDRRRAGFGMGSF